MAPPTDQRADKRPIAFRLETGLGGTLHVPLTIRPEELVDSKPVLQSKVPTLGGAFIDDWGLGLRTINISGHTGWRGSETGDGVQQYHKLAGVPDEWHASRKKLAEQGQNPSACKLFFIDDLNETCVLVAPGEWQLRRSKARPLLMMYSLPMTVITDRIQPATTDPIDIDNAGGAPTVKRGIASLNQSIDRIASAAARSRDFIDANLVDPLHQVMDRSTTIMRKVVDVVSDARGVVTAEAAQFISIARDFSAMGRNVFHTYNAIATLPDFARNTVSAVAAEFHNADCILRNAFRHVREYPDFEGIYGASNCSSTIGGSPLSPYANTNPWEIILPVRSDVAGVTPEARENIDALKAADPVRYPMTAEELAGRTQLAMGGVTFQWQ